MKPPGLSPLGKVSLQFGPRPAVFPDGDGHEKWGPRVSWGGGGGKELLVPPVSSSKLSKELCLGLLASSLLPGAATRPFSAPFALSPAPPPPAPRARPAPLLAGFQGRLARLGHCHNHLAVWSCEAHGVESRL